MGVPRSIEEAKARKQFQKEIGGRLARLREGHGYRLSAMAELLGLSWQRYNNYEKGARPLDLLVLVAICAVFNVSADWLLLGKRRRS